MASSGVWLFTGKDRVPKNVTRVQFAPSVTKVDREAFRDCTDLKVVVFNEASSRSDTEHSRVVHCWKRKEKPRANAKPTNHGGRNSEIAPYDAAADNAAHGTALRIRPRLTLSNHGRNFLELCPYSTAAVPENCSSVIAALLLLSATSRAKATAPPSNPAPQPLPEMHR